MDLDISSPSQPPQQYQGGDIFEMLGNAINNNPSALNNANSPPPPTNPLNMIPPGSIDLLMDANNNNEPAPFSMQSSNPPVSYGELNNPYSMQSNSDFAT